jgi:hypothetical protein
LDQELTTQWEHNVEWYEKTANRPSKWGELKNNVPKQWKRDEWGGSSEINIWVSDNHQNNNGRNKCRQWNSADTLPW